MSDPAAGDCGRSQAENSGQRRIYSIRTQEISATSPKCISVSEIYMGAVYRDADTQVAAYWDF